MLRARARQQPRQSAHLHQQRQSRNADDALYCSKAAAPSNARALSVFSSRSKIWQSSSWPVTQSILPAMMSPGMADGNSTAANWSVRYGL